MKIVIASPLYPPDSAPSARYVKELARRLARDHTLTVVTYGRLPEKVRSVSLIAIDKRLPLPVRLFRFTLGLLRALRGADVLYVENGTSVELPVVLLSFVTKIPLLTHIGDRPAHLYAQKRFMRRVIEHQLHTRSLRVITDLPHSRPEIMPLESYPENAFRDYEDSWESHITMLNTLLHDARKH